MEVDEKVEEAQTSHKCCSLTLPQMEDFNGDSHQLRQVAPNNTAAAAVAAKTQLKKFELVDKEVSL